MLILSRAIGEAVVIDGRIKVIVIDIPTENRVRLGIDAPRDITVHREEIQRKVDRENEDKEDR